MNRDDIKINVEVDEMISPIDHYYVYLCIEYDNESTVRIYDTADPTNSTSPPASISIGGYISRESIEELTKSHRDEIIDIAELHKMCRVSGAWRDVLLTDLARGPRACDEDYDRAIELLESYDKLEELLSMIDDYDYSQDEDE